MIATSIRPSTVACLLFAVGTPCISMAYTCDMADIERNGVVDFDDFFLFGVHGRRLRDPGLPGSAVVRGPPCRDRERLGLQRPLRGVSSAPSRGITTSVSPERGSAYRL